MQQLILNSVLLATFAIPAAILRQPGSGDGDFRLVLGPFAAFVALYVAALLFVYPRLF